MIDAELRKAVAALATRGMSAREISLRLKISRNTVRAIIAQDGKGERRERNDKIPLDRDLLAQLYAECGGYAQRVHWHEHAGGGGTSTRERACLKDLEHLAEVMATLPGRATDSKLTSGAFRAQAHILLENILARSGEFVNAMRRFHDRCRAS